MVTFHHISIICSNLEENLRVFCDQLNQEDLGSNEISGIPNSAILKTDSDVALHLLREPLLDQETAAQKRYPYGIHQISYRVDDVDHIYEKLRATGVQIAWEAQDTPAGRNCGFYDEDGLLFEISNSAHYFAGSEIPNEDTPNCKEIHMHHVAILTPNLRRAQRFYEEILGLRTVLELTKNDGGLVFMVDERYDHWKNNFMLEIVGPPDLEPREIDLLKQRGACYDHLCFVADDVKKAWKRIIQKGGVNASPPSYYHGTWMAWIKDADGNDLEIMQPIPKFVIDIALESGKELNGYQLIQASKIVTSHMIKKSFKYIIGATEKKT